VPALSFGAHQGQGSSSRGGTGAGSSSGGGTHHHQGAAPTPARFVLAHHSIIVPKAVRGGSFTWGHAALHNARRGVTSVSVSAGCAAAAVAAAATSSRRHQQSQSLHKPSRPRRLSVVAGSMPSFAQAPASSFDDEQEEEEECDPEQDPNDCVAPDWENCPVSPEFHDARVVGLYKLKPVDLTHSFESAWFQPFYLTYEVKTRFQQKLASNATCTATVCPRGSPSRASSGRTSPSAWPPPPPCLFFSSPCRRSPRTPRSSRRAGRTRWRPSRGGALHVESS
jgi:hypothetical protein